MNKLQNDIVDLLNRWEVGTINEIMVLTEAEKLFEQHYQESDLPKTDYRSIPIEVLSHLEILNNQWIIKDDICAIKEFLNTPKGEELKAWDNWIEYWNSIDFEQRKMKLNGNGFYIANQSNT